MNVQAFYDYWRGWFAQPGADKVKHLRQSGKGGYYPPFSEAPGYTGKPDPKEYFHWRIDQMHPDWDFQTLNVFAACYEAADAWCNRNNMSGLARKVRSSDCVLRILHYPQTPDGNVGQQHCDFDLLTVSIPGTCPGLEVYGPTEDGCHGWKKHEAFEVHVGEMMSIHTAAHDPWLKIMPTLHRVRTPPNTERFKAVFFYLPPNDLELRPGYTAGDYLKEALTKAGTINIGAKKS